MKPKQPYNIPLNVSHQQKIILMCLQF